MRGRSNNKLIVFYFYSDIWSVIPVKCFDVYIIYIYIHIIIMILRRPEYNTQNQTIRSLTQKTPLKCQMYSIFIYFQFPINRRINEK